MSEAKEESVSIYRIQTMQGEINRMCNNLDFANTEAKKSGKDAAGNWNEILSTIARDIILSAFAFKEEAEELLQKYYSQDGKEISVSLSELDKLLSGKNYMALKNIALLQHNKLGGKEGYKLLNFSEIKNLVPPQNYADYISINPITYNIRMAIADHFVPKGE